MIIQGEELQEKGIGGEEDGQLCIIIAIVFIMSAPDND